MAKFFVGQRVRWKAVDNPEAVHMVGSEDRITDEFCSGRGTEWELASSWCTPKDCASDFITPILPEGHRASDESFHDLMDRLRAGELVGEPA